MTADQVRNQFISQGFQADAPVTWYTTNATSFRVYDTRESAAGRVLMVLVYPDLATAQSERSQAEAHEATDALSSGSGPHLVPSYGPSTWLGNVALVESTWGQLAQMYAAEHAQDDPGASTSANLMQPATPPVMRAVDVDFLTALNNGTVNL
jgi:hypothetical protein